MEIDFTESEILDKEEDFEENCELDRPVAHQAAANGETETLTRAIRADPTILEHKDVEGLTPLIHAVMAQQLDSVKLLVKMGASINTSDSMGRTCLSMAAYQGWYHGVQLLLRNGAQPGMCDNAGRSPLHSATYCTDLKVMEAILQCTTEDDIDAQDHEGMSPLHWAVFHNRPLHIELLVSKCADPTLVDMDGKTVMHWAVMNNCLECCDILLKLYKGGIDMVNQQDFTGKTPVHFASAAGHAEVIIKLADIEACDLEAEDPEERIHTITRGLSRKVLDLVLYEDEVELYLDIENDNEISEDLAQTTPLHWAAATGQADTVKTLLDLKVEAGPVDVDGNTPLDYARQSGHQECVGLLERQLGIHQSAHEQTGQCSPQEPTTRNRRSGPLDFFVGLFRPKKSLKTDPNFNLSSDNSNYCSRDPNQNNYFTLNVTLNGAAEAEGADQCSEDGTRHCKEDVNTDLEKLRISRGDNPVLRKKTSPEFELNEIPPAAARPKDLPPWKAGGKTFSAPPSDNESVESKSYPDHSHLIRSPPPLLRRDHSLSPVPSPSVMLRSETNRAQLEEDAAQILALHKGGSKPDQGPSGSASGNSLQPITVRPGADLSPVSPRKPMTIPESGSRQDASPAPVRNQSVQLAPIKGPVPPKGVLLNKRLEHIKSERTGMNRSPSPPGWLNSSSQNSQKEPQANHTSSMLPQRRKKKKKKSLFTDSVNGDSDIDTTEYLSVKKSSRGDTTKKSSTTNRSSLPMATPRNDNVTSQKRNSDLDRSINSLLH